MLALRQLNSIGDDLIAKSQLPGHSEADFALWRKVEKYFDRNEEKIRFFLSRKSEQDGKNYGYKKFRYRIFTHLKAKAEKKRITKKDISSAVYSFLLSNERKSQMVSHQGKSLYRYDLDLHTAKGTQEFINSTSPEALVEKQRLLHLPLRLQTQRDLVDMILQGKRLSQIANKTGRSQTLIRESVRNIVRPLLKEDAKAEIKPPEGLETTDEVWRTLSYWQQLAISMRFDGKSYDELKQAGIGNPYTTIMKAAKKLGITIGDVTEKFEAKQAELVKNNIDMQNQRLLDLVFTAEEQKPKSAELRKEHHAMLIETIKGLAEKMRSTKRRTALSLHMQGKSYREIEAEMEIPFGHASKYLSRIRDQLREMFFGKSKTKS